MIIRNLDVIYTVIQVEDSNTRFDTFICKREDTGRAYRVFRIKNPILLKSLAEFFLKQVQNEAFEDFKETFVEEGYLYAVVVIHREKLLVERLEEEKPEFSERLLLGENVLKKLLLCKMPAYFATHCLLKEQLLADEAGEIMFQCALNDVANWQKYSCTDYTQALVLCMKMLFKEEIKRKADIPILRFINQLEQGSYKDDLEIYQQYLEAKKASLSVPDEMQKENHTWPFRVWKKLRKCLSPLKKIIAALILIGVIGFVCYELFVPEKSNGHRETIFQYIGTVTIEEGEEE